MDFTLWWWYHCNFLGRRKKRDLNFSFYHYQRFSRISERKWEIVKSPIYHKGRAQLDNLFRPHSVHPPPPTGGGVWTSNQIFQKRRGLTGPQLLEGVAGKEGGDFFQGGCNFHIKNKLKSEIFNDKKSL